jgi:5-methylcytosine-specific restriction endonuclease McrA
MKRSELQRRTPLKRTPLKSATGWQAMDAPVAPLRKPTKRKPKARFAKDVRAFIAFRDRGCVVCKAPRLRVEMHHVLPQSKFPAYAKRTENLVALCAGCHDEHERAHRRIRYDELPEQVRTWVRTLGGREEIYMERTYPR